MFQMKVCSGDVTHLQRVPLCVGELEMSSRKRPRMLLFIECRFPTHLFVSTRSWGARQNVSCQYQTEMFIAQLESKSVTAWSPLGLLDGLSLSIVLIGRKLVSVNNAKPQFRLFPQSFSRLREDAWFIGGWVGRQLQTWVRWMLGVMGIKKCMRGMTNPRFLF